MNLEWRTGNKEPGIESGNNTDPTCMKFPTCLT